MDVCLNILETRVAALESDIGLGLNDEKITDALVTLNTAAKNLAAARDRVKIVFKRADEIQECVTPGFIEVQSMDLSAQREYILLMEENIHDTVKSLTRVQELSAVLNSENIRQLQSKGPAKMKGLQTKQLTQLKLTEDVSDEIAELVKIYNTLVMQMSRYLIQISDIVNNLEFDASKEKEKD